MEITIRKVDVEQPNEIEIVTKLEERATDNVIKQTAIRKLFKAAWDAIEEYCSNSTLHGVRHFVEEKRHWVERFWWIVGFVISTCCCGALIHKIYVNWDQKAVIITIAEKEMPVWDIPFPAVTICPGAKIATTHAIDIPGSGPYSYTVYTPDVYTLFFIVEVAVVVQMTLAYKITDEEFKIQMALSNLCDYQIDTNENLTDNSIIRTLRMVMPYFNDTIGSCTFDNSECEFHEIITDQGVCFTLNMLNSKETYYNDSIYSHVGHNNMAHWSLDYGYDIYSKKSSQTYPSRLFGSGADGQNIHFLMIERNQEEKYRHIQNCRPPGFNVVLHTPGEIPQVSKYSFYLSPKAAVKVVLKPTMTTTSEELKSYHPDRRKCYFNTDRKLRFLRVYTQRNCELECLANFTLSVCGCVKFYMPRDAETPICGIGKSNCYKWALNNLSKGQMKKEYSTKEWEYRRLRHLVDRCNCLPACNSITYDTETINYEMLEESYVDLNIFFKERKFITMARSELYGPIDFIASCGGLLGLFIGASFLSLFELFYFFSLRLYCKSQPKTNRKSLISVFKKRKNTKSKNRFRISTASKLVLLKAVRKNKRVGNSATKASFRLRRFHSA